MIFIIATLIVYGMSLLIVQGTIFDGLKIRLAKFINKLEKSMEINYVKIVDFLESDNKNILDYYKKIYLSIREKLRSVTDENHIESLHDTHNKLIKKIHNDIFVSKFIMFKKMLLFILLKIQKVTSCMMCMSFWVGFGICLLSVFIPLNLFNIPFVLLLFSNSLQFYVSIFLLSCLFSGTTWVIHTCVDLINELKDRLGELIDTLRK